MVLLRLPLLDLLRLFCIFLTLAGDLDLQWKMLTCNLTPRSSLESRLSTYIF